MGGNGSGGHRHGSGRPRRHGVARDTRGRIVYPRADLCQCGRQKDKTAKKCMTCYNATRRQLIDKECAVCRTLFRPTHRTTRCCSSRCGLELARQIAYLSRLSPEAKSQTNRQKMHRRRLAGWRAQKGRWRIIGERDGWRCWLCQTDVNPNIIAPDPLSPSVDHVVPLSRGGSDEDSNLRLAHFSCNARRGADLRPSKVAA